MQSQTDSKPEITKDIIISDLVQHYPDVVDMLIVEYGFHCVQCIISGYETLEQGAEVHGIVNDDFEDMLKDIEHIVNKN